MKNIKVLQKFSVQHVFIIQRISEKTSVQLFVVKLKFSIKRTCVESQFFYTFASLRFKCSSMLWYFSSINFIDWYSCCLNAFYDLSMICLCIWLNCVVSGWFCTRPFGFLMLPKGERTGLEIKKSISLSFFSLL